MILVSILLGYVGCYNLLSNSNKSRHLRGSGQSASSRDPKFLSIFSLVSFPNNECLVKDPDNDWTEDLCGTCLSGSGCDAAGGIIAGSCAQGFGACCLLYQDTCGGTVSRNRTYIRNPNYPGTYQDSGTCTWTFEKCQTDICRIRLDYETFSIQQPDNTATKAGSCSAKDRFEGNPVTGANLPVICGEATGQHMYLDAGAGSSDQATLVATLTGNQSPMWKIKVSMIECGSLSVPPNGCMQYHTGLTGTIRSFNFNAPSSAYNHLQGQNYRACIRQEEGYCKIGWQQSNDEFSFKLARPTTNVNSFTGTDHMNCASPTGSNCDYVTIPNGSNGDAKNCQIRTPPATPVSVPQVDQYGGAALTCISGTSTAYEVVSDTFTLGVFFNNFEGTTNNRGFCLNYRQIPC